MCLASYIRTLYRGHVHLQGHVFPGGLDIRIINLVSRVCGMDRWVSYRVSVLQSVVAVSIFSCGDHGIY